MGTHFSFIFTAYFAHSLRAEKNLKPSFFHGFLGVQRVYIFIFEGAGMLTANLKINLELKDLIPPS